LNSYMDHELFSLTNCFTTLSHWEAAYYGGHVHCTSCVICLRSQSCQQSI